MATKLIPGLQSFGGPHALIGDLVRFGELDRQFPRPLADRLVGSVLVVVAVRFHPRNEHVEDGACDGLRPIDAGVD